MAMTKRFKVTFDVTVKISSEHEQNMHNNVLKIAKRAHAGEKLSGLEREFLVRCLTGGPEAGAEFAMQQSIRTAIRENLSEDDIKISPATIRVVS